MKVTFANDADREYFANVLIHDVESQNNLNRHAGSITTILSTNHDAYGCTLVIKDGQDYVGFIKVSNHPLDNRCCIDDIFVTKEYRGIGNGRKLTEYAIRYCINSWPNIQSIYLFTIDGAYKAEKLYESLGFHNCGHYANWLRDGRGQTLWQLEVIK